MYRICFKNDILYDTGYSMNILKNNLKYFLYRFANPITLKKVATIDLLYIGSTDNMANAPLQQRTLFYK